MASRFRYIPALDGLRALAVAAVVLYHLSLGWAQGGMIGVTVFFVLSGYLITRLLVREFAQTHRIDLKRFWIRRTRRLLPLVVTVVVVTAALCTVFNHVMLTKMRPDIVPSLLFFNNWWQILHQVSYFNAVGDPSPLTHFWSLAIEEQFYLVWPLLLMGAMSLGERPKTLRRGTLALAIVSALAMALLYQPDADPSRVYYGTDTRVFSLLLGAWLALIADRQLSAPAIFERLKTLIPAAGSALDALPAPLRRAPLDVLGVLGLAGLAAMVAFTNGYSAFPYYGGTLLCSLLTVAVIAACSRPESLIGRALSCKPFVWLGQRSYGIYLWHYPLLLLMNPASKVSDTPWWMTILQVAIVLGVSELSYRVIETPFRHGALGSFVQGVREQRDNLPRFARSFARRHVVTGTATLAAVLVACAGLAFVPETSALSEQGAKLLQGDSAASDQKSGSADGKQTGTDQPKTEQTEQDKKAAEDKSAAEKKAKEDHKNPFPENAYDVLMIGDSVSLRAVPYFQQTFPHGNIDAAMNRQFDAGRELYESYLQQNLAGKIAVFALGTNGPINSDMVDAVMRDAGDQRIVVFVNTRSNTDWVGQVNQTLADAATRYKNVRVVDWFAYSANRIDLFDGDGTHLSEQGAQEYIQLVYNAIQDVLPEHPQDDAQPAAAPDQQSAA